MDTAIIAAIIGAFATVFVAVLQLRKESNSQHGTLMRKVDSVQATQADIIQRIDETHQNLVRHIADHEYKPKPKVAVKKAPATKKPR